MPNNNLATKNENDFTVTPNGKCFISQRKAAELCDVARTTIQSFIKSRPVNVDISQGLSPDLLQKVVQYYAYKGNKTCQMFLDKLLGDGATVFIYKQAGYVFNAVLKPELTPKPVIKTQLELAEEQVALLIELAEKDVELQKSKEAKAKIYEEFVESLSVIGLRDFKGCADRIGIIGFGRNTMLKCLRHKEWLNVNNKPYRSQIENGRFVVKTLRKEYSDGKVWSKDIVMVTEKGLVDILLIAQDWLDAQYKPSQPAPVVTPVQPAPPPPSEPTLIITSPCKDLQAWLDMGWTIEGMIEAGHAKYGSVH